MSSPAPRTRRLHRRSIPRSTAATIGIPACTCTGCSHVSGGHAPVSNPCVTSMRCSTARLAPEPIAAELAYLARAHSQSFERTYGWAWLLKLAAELSRHDDPQGQRWSTRAGAARPGLRATLPRLPRRAPATRSGTACMRTARSGSPSRSIIRGLCITASWSGNARRLHGRGLLPIAMPLRAGSHQARISFRRR